MTTIKSYTDIEQSEALSKILPLESADMYWWSSGKRYYIEAMDDGDFVENRDIRAWSLAALLDVFPPYLFEFERGIDFNVYPNLNGKGWHCSYMPNCIENMKKDKFRLITSKDSLVDACVEMIEKLNELNLL